MGFDSLPAFVVHHLQCIAVNEGFAEGYDVKHESGSRVGDGFSGLMLAIKLVGYRRKEPNDDLKLDELSLICKLQPATAAHRKSFNSELMFQREVYMYSKLLPAFEAFQKERKVSEEIALTCFPKCYVAFHEDGNSESIIVLEDLRAAGFEMWEKQKPTNFEIVRPLMEQLGRFHGLSFAVRDQNPEMFKVFEELPKQMVKIFTSPGVAAMFGASYSDATSLMDNAEDIAAMKQILKDVGPILRDGLDAELLGNYGVVSHGDCWIFNMMFMLDNVRDNSGRLKMFNVY